MRENISLVTKLNELRLMLIHPQSKHKVFILVEGDSDIKLYRKLFHDNNTVIKTIPGGYTNLEAGIQELAKDYNSVIGIRDADFLHIENKKTTIPVLFLTDVHDLEMMLIVSNETFKSILFEFKPDEVTDINKIRNNFLESVKFIGYLRWYNSIHNLELNFKDFGLGDFVNPVSLVLDDMKCINNLLQRSPNKKIRDGSVLLTEVKALINSTHDLTQICCGHDVTKVIALYFTNDKSNKGLSSERIESQLRTSYHFQHFQQTKLYDSLQKWSVKNKYKIFEE